MRRDIRWRVALPISFFLVALQPALRAFPAGSFLPDFGLVLLFVFIPAVGSRSPWFPPILVFWIGAFRAGVSAISPLSSWAGFGLSILLRRWIHRQVSPHSFFLRFSVGVISAIPSTSMDALVSAQWGVDFPMEVFWARCLGVGLLWAFFTRPSSLRRGLSS